MRIFFLILLFTFGMAACSTPTQLRFHKQRLLDVTMDESKISAPTQKFHANAYGLYERGAVSDAKSYGSSCPTCGS